MAEVLFHPDGITNRVKIIAGEVALDGTNPTSIPYSGKLSTIVAVYVTILNASAPGLGTQVLTYAVDTTNKEVDIHAWKPSSTTIHNLVASTGTETVSYVIVGF